jgi:hypothetical protein
MPDIVREDEWKNGRCGYAADEPHRKRITGPSRAMQQIRIDSDYAFGRVTRDEWKEETDTLSHKAADGSILKSNGLS